MLRKLTRVVLNVLAALSLALLVTTASLWAVSYARRSGLVLYQIADRLPAVEVGIRAYTRIACGLEGKASIGRCAFAGSGRWKWRVHSASDAGFGAKRKRFMH